MYYKMKFVECGIEENRDVAEAVNLLAPELFFFILAHSVYKM